VLPIFNLCDNPKILIYQQFLLLEASNVIMRVTLVEDTLPTHYMACMFFNLVILKM
jgi:hypothetical protein